jgi:regulator-associated protein of mTOR
MTAVALHNRNDSRPQYSPRQSPRSSRASPSSQARPPTLNEPPAAPVPSTSATTNGPRNQMTARDATYTLPSRTMRTDGGQPVGPSAGPAFPTPNDMNTTNNDHSRDGEEFNRPTSAMGSRVVRIQSLSTINAGRDSTTEDSDREPVRRRPAPLLQRSKSDFGPRNGNSNEDSDSHRQDSDTQEWGARHGFEDHYASEEYVSQLANVSAYIVLL